MRTEMCTALFVVMSLSVGCSDLANTPADSVHLTEGHSYTRNGTKANQSLGLVVDITAEAGTQIIQYRVWSLGNLAGIDAAVTAGDGTVLWTGVRAGTELLIPALPIEEAGAYTLTIRWLHGAGIASYRYDTLYEGDETITDRSDVHLMEGRVSHQATVLNNGAVLLSGGDAAATTRGHAGIQAMDTAEIVDPTSGQSTLVGPMMVGRAFHTATRIESPESSQHGHVLIAGGLTAAGAMRETDVYDPETNTFEAGPKLPGPRAYQASMAVTGTNSFLDGTILLVGGEYTRPGPQHDFLEGLYSEVDENPTNSPTTTVQKAERSSMWYFRPGDAAIKRVGQELKYGRLLPTLSLLADGRILILGGGIDSLPTKAGCSPQTLGCKCSSQLPLCTHYVCDDEGCDANQYKNYVRKDVATDLVEVYDTNTGLLTELPARLNKARVGHTATVLADGRVLIVGGATSSRRNFQSGEGGMVEYPQTLDSVELFEPLTNTFRVLAPLAIPREGHQLILLPGGCAAEPSNCAVLVGGMYGVAGGVAPVSALSWYQGDTEQFLVTDFLSHPRSGSSGSFLTTANAILVAAGATSDGLGAETQTAEILSLPGFSGATSSDR